MSRYLQMPACCWIFNQLGAVGESHSLHTTSAKKADNLQKWYMCRGYSKYIDPFPVKTYGAFSNLCPMRTHNPQQAFSTVFKQFSIVNRKTRPINAILRVPCKVIFKVKPAILAQRVFFNSVNLLKVECIHGRTFSKNEKQESGSMHGCKPKHLQLF